MSNFSVYPLYDPLDSNWKHDSELWTMTLASTKLVCVPRMMSSCVGFSSLCWKGNPSIGLPDYPKHDQLVWDSSNKLQYPVRNQSALPFDFGGPCQYSTKEKGTSLDVHGTIKKGGVEHLKP